MSIVDIDQMCKWKQSKTYFSLFQNYSKDIIVLSKLHDEIAGTGYKCQTERITANYSKSFFGVETVSKSDWTPIKIDDKECWKMVKSERCTIKGNDFTYDKKMNCDSNGCSIEEYPNEKYTWLSTNTIYGYKCSFYKISILGENELSALYLDKKCIAKEFSCILGKSTVVWDKSVIHQCPYEEITYKGEFTWEEGMFLVNRKVNLLLQPTDAVIDCDLNL